MAKLFKPDKVRWGADQDKALTDYFDNIIESGADCVPIDTQSKRQAWEELDPTRTRNSFYHNYKTCAEKYNKMLKQRAEKNGKLLFSVHL